MQSPPHVLLLRQIQLRHQRCLPAQPALRPHPHLGRHAALPAAQGCAAPHSGAGGHQWGGIDRGASPWGTTQHHRASTTRISPQIEQEQRRWLHQRPHDLALVLVLLLMASFTFFRGMVSAGGTDVPWGGGQTVHWGGLLATLGSVQVVLDCPADSCFEYIYQHEPYLRDPVAYPKVQVSASSGDPCATQDTTTALSLCSQMLIYLFYVLPFLCLCIYALLRPGCSWLPDWSLVFAGAVAQVRAGSRGGVGGQVGTHPASGAAPRAASAA